MDNGEAASFAEALQELKDRTPHSFETLATHIGISRSALHRYCTAKGVPSDFAVVERFGKRCRASREELIELHRLWTLAGAARAPAARRARVTSAAPAADPAEEAGTRRARRARPWVTGLAGAAVTATAVGIVLSAVRAVRRRAGGRPRRGAGVLSAGRSRPGTSRSAAPRPPGPALWAG
jgi:hypothetical protein